MNKKEAKELYELFSFEKRDIVHHIFDAMDMKGKFIKAFSYICDRLPVQSLGGDSSGLGKLEWEKGKNYNWAVLQEGDLTFVIRAFRYHYTFFFRDRSQKETFIDDPKWNDRYYTKWGCFTFESDRDLMKDPDMMVDNNFMDIDGMIRPIIKLFKEKGAWLLWNDAALPRPKHVKIKNVWNGGDEDLASIDLFVFCLEELFSKYLELFAETVVLERLKGIKVGDMISTYKVTKVSTEVNGSYYHSAGLAWKNTNFKGDKESWQDVYSLARYYTEVFLSDDQKGE